MYLVSLIGESAFHFATIDMAFIKAKQLSKANAGKSVVIRAGESVRAFARDGQLLGVLTCDGCKGTTIAYYGNCQRCGATGIIPGEETP